MPVKFLHAAPANSGLAGLRCLFDDPSVLADGSSAGAPLASTREIAFPRARPGLDRHVD